MTHQFELWMVEMALVSADVSLTHRTEMVHNYQSSLVRLSNFSFVFERASAIIKFIFTQCYGCCYITIQRFHFIMIIQVESFEKLRKIFTS